MLISKFSPRTLAAPINHFGGGTLVLQHVCLCTDGKNLAVLYRYGLCAGLQIVDSDDVTASVNGICFLFDCGSTCAGANPYRYGYGNNAHQTSFWSISMVHWFPHPMEKKPKFIYLIEEDYNILKEMPRGLPDQYFFRHPEGVKGCKPGQKYGDKYLYKYWKKV